MHAGSKSYAVTAENPGRPTVALHSVAFHKRRHRRSSQYHTIARDITLVNPRNSVTQNLRCFIVSGRKEQLAPLVGLKGLELTTAAFKLITETLGLSAEEQVHVLDVIRRPSEIRHVGRPTRPQWEK